MTNHLKPSFYNLVFDIDCKEVLFNTNSGNLIELGTELREALADGNLADVPLSILQELGDLGFVVHSVQDERAAYLQRYEHSKGHGGALSVKLFMATSCNLGCPYCYQAAPTKSGNVIRKEQLDRFLKWIDIECKNDAINGLELELYGGEPLLAKLLMPGLIESINQICGKHQVPVRFEIVTNATLMDDTIIDLFIRNRVFMQITLDGDKVTHDNRRAWKKTGEGSFDTIFNNLEKISQRGGAELVRLRMNVDQHNVGEVEQLARKAHALGIGSFSCGRIHFREKQMDYETSMISSAEFDESLDLQIFRILGPLGYADSPSNLESKDTCLYHWTRGFAVSPTLEFFKCDELIDYPEYCVGRINSNGNLVMNIGEYEKAVSRKPTDFEYCASCRYLPQCGSGCSIRALNVTGTPHAHFCETTHESVRRRVASYVRAEDQGLIIKEQESNCSKYNCGACQF